MHQDISTHKEPQQLLLDETLVSIDVETRIECVEPVYDAELLDKLRDAYTKEEIQNHLDKVSSLIEVWKSQVKDGGRLLFVSDPWIAEEFRGGSLLLRNFYGMLKNLDVPVEWWTVGVGDNVAGQEYHTACYSIYEGLKGAHAPLSQTDTLNALPGYHAVNRKLAKELSIAAEMKNEDTVMLLDINAMGLAPALRDSSKAPQNIIENLRIGTRSSDPTFVETMQLLENQNIYEALDLIFHLHDSFVWNHEKERCIGGFFYFTDDSYQSEPAHSYEDELRTILATSVHVSTRDEFKHAIASEQTLIHIGNSSPDWQEGRTTFYLGARLDSSKNQRLAIQAFRKAVEERPYTMEDARLVLLSPTPSRWNNSVEKEAMDAVLNPLIEEIESLPDAIRNRISYLFVPPEHDTLDNPNFRVNRALQQLSDCHLCISTAEGLPNTIFEAMNLKKPSIVNNICGMEAQVEDQVTGLKIAVSESTLAEAYCTMCSRQDREEMGAAAYERLRSMYSPLTYTERFFRELVSLRKDEAS